MSLTTLGIFISVISMAGHISAQNPPYYYCNNAAYLTANNFCTYTGATSVINGINYFVGTPLPIYACNGVNYAYQSQRCTYAGPFQLGNAQYFVGTIPAAASYPAGTYVCNPLGPAVQATGAAGSPQPDPACTYPPAPGLNLGGVPPIILYSGTASPNYVCNGNAYATPVTLCTYPNPSALVGNIPTFTGVVATHTLYSCPSSRPGFLSATQIPGCNYG